MFLNKTKRPLRRRGHTRGRPRYQNLQTGWFILSRANHYTFQCHVLIFYECFTSQPLQPDTDLISTQVEGDTQLDGVGKGKAREVDSEDDVMPKRLKSNL